MSIGEFLIVDDQSRGKSFPEKEPGMAVAFTRTNFRALEFRLCKHHRNGPMEEIGRYRLAFPLQMFLRTDSGQGPFSLHDLT